MSCKFISLSLTERQSIYDRLTIEYPNHLPIIVYSNDIEISIERFLLPNDQILYDILKCIKLNSITHTYFSVNNNILELSDKGIDVYNKYKNTDGFLYLKLNKKSSGLLSSSYGWIRNLFNI